MAWNDNKAAERWAHGPPNRYQKLVKGGRLVTAEQVIREKKEREWEKKKALLHKRSLKDAVQTGKLDNFGLF